MIISEKEAAKRINHIAKSKTKTWCGRTLSRVVAHPWASSRGWKVCSQCLYNKYGKGHVAKR